MKDQLKDGDARVGYRRTPLDTRFKKGKSGNPRGRPKGSKNLLTDLREELSELIHIREGGRERRVSKQRAFIKALVATAVKGDGRATAALVSLCARAFPDRAEENDKNGKLSPSDDRILQEFIDREIDRRSTAQLMKSRPEANSKQENSK